MTTLATQKHKARKLPGGKHLARIAYRASQARSPVREINSWADFQAASAELRDSNASRGAQLWQAIGLAMVRTDLVAKDLRARIEALESEIAGKATAKAAPAKTVAEAPLRIRLVRDIDNKSVAPLLEKIEGAHGRDVKLSLETRGGHVNAAKKLASAIEKHGRVDCHAVTACDSAGLLVWASGRRRSALKGATFLLHAPTLDGRAAETPGEQRRLDQIAKGMAAFLSKRSGTPAAHFLKHMTVTGTTLNAGDMSANGLLNATIRRPHVARKGKSK